MCTVRPDLTAHEVIRRTAMELFAERGADRVSIRDLASAAGVSPALVIHHYGSKSGLRAAVDQRALELMEGLIAEVVGAMGSGSAPSIAGLFESGLGTEPHLLGYLRRVLVEGGDLADTVFQRLFELTCASTAALEQSGVLRPATDPAVRAAFLLANDLAVVLLRERITAALGSDPLTGDGLVAWSEQVLDTYAHGVIAGLGPDGVAS